MVEEQIKNDYDNLSFRAKTSRSNLTLLYVEKTYGQIRKKRLRSSIIPRNPLCKLEHKVVSEMRLMSSCHYITGHQPPEFRPG
jgi:hypothetical protein